MLTYSPVLPLIRIRIDADLRRPGLPRGHVLLSSSAWSRVYSGTG
jgi:hypothetical protein